MRSFCLSVVVVSAVMLLLLLLLLVGGKCLFVVVVSWCERILGLLCEFKYLIEAGCGEKYRGNREENGGEREKKKNRNESHVKCC